MYFSLCFETAMHEKQYATTKMGDANSSSTSSSSGSINSTTISRSSSFEHLPYKKLQKMAKKHGIRSNQSKVNLIKALKDGARPSEPKRSRTDTHKDKADAPKQNVTFSGSAFHEDDTSLIETCRLIDNIEEGLTSHLKDLIKLLVLLSRQISCASAPPSLKLLKRFMISPRLTFMLNCQLEKDYS